MHHIVSIKWLIWLYLVIGPPGRGRFDPNTTLANPDFSVNQFADFYRKKLHISKEIKYILMWTTGDFSPFVHEAKGQHLFITSNCSMTNCYITEDRNFFGEDTTKFHAIAFNGRHLNNDSVQSIPKVRSTHQKYIFFTMESNVNYPLRNYLLDNFFNWTATYKLNSDILYNYFMIKDMNGTVVGPGQNMKWVENMSKINDELAKRFENKTKAAAWFVSHCKTNSKRGNFVTELQNALAMFNLTLDIYGNCGPLKCAKSKEKDCDSMLANDYYFYMALENSIAEDYVTEKLLRALQHYTVPIVFGGANYSRFLPPGSYLNGLEYINSPLQLAIRMYCIINSPESYQRFFKWQNHYTYHDSQETNICSVCDALNNKTMFDTTSVYTDMHKWWNGKSLGRDIRRWKSKKHNKYVENKYMKTKKKRRWPRKKTPSKS